MKALVIHRPEAAAWDVYLYHDTGGGTRVAYTVAQTGGGYAQRRVEQVPEGGEMPRFLRLGDDEMEALGAALIGALPVDAGMAAMLADTRVVRDRLLTLIETVVLTDAHSPRRDAP